MNHRRPAQPQRSHLLPPACHQRQNWLGWESPSSGCGQESGGRVLMDWGPQGRELGLPSVTACSVLSPGVKRRTVNEYLEGQSPGWGMENKGGKSRTCCLGFSTRRWFEPIISPIAHPTHVLRKHSGPRCWTLIIRRCHPYCPVTVEEAVPSLRPHTWAWNCAEEGEQCWGCPYPLNVSLLLILVPGVLQL